MRQFPFYMGLLQNSSQEFLYPDMRKELPQNS